MELRDIKQRFFALRNGLLADNLRKKASDSHRMIFGLNIPQLKEIADECGKNLELARILWSDTSCRESRLLAPMVYPSDNAAPAQWLGEIQTPEEADVLCHRLLRHYPETVDEALRLAESEDPRLRYAALRLMLNQLPAHAKLAKQMAESEIESSIPLTAIISRQILDELEFTAS